MAGAAELQPLTRSLAFWRAYDPGVKAELSSAALRFEDRVYLVDPISLAPGEIEEPQESFVIPTGAEGSRGENLDLTPRDSSAPLRSARNDPVYRRPPSGWACGAKVAAIVVTNVNHARAAGSFAAKTGAPIRASAETANQLSELKIVSLGAGKRVAERLEVIALEGAAAGEIALHFDDEEGGAIILGDALIHFGSDGFALLPEKYCTDQPGLRRSLRQLLDFRFERLLFAHGQPLVADARTRLERILR